MKRLQPVIGWVVLGGFLAFSAGQARAGEKNDYVQLLSGLPQDSQVVLMLDLGAVGRLYQTLWSKVERIPLVLATPKLKSWLGQQRLMAQTMVTAMSARLGLDPFRDLDKAVVGIQVGQDAQPLLLARVTGRFRAGLLDSLMPPAAAQKQAGNKVYPVGDGLLVVQPKANLLLLGDPQGVKAALKGGAKGTRVLLGRHPGLAKKTGPDFLLRASMVFPRWLQKKVEAEPDAAVIKPLLAGLRGVEIHVDKLITLKVVAASKKSADSWFDMLNGWQEFGKAGHHAFRAYALMGLAIDLAVVEELPPMVRQALANRQALRQTIDHLWPVKPVASKLSRQGKTLKLVSAPDAFAGAPATMGVLAAVAIPAFIEYIRKSKQAEGYALIEQVAAAEEHHKLTNGGYLACPAHPPQLAGSQSQAWGQNACFEKLGVHPSNSYFSIQVDVLPDGNFEIRARADLDDDGQPVTLTRRSNNREIERSPIDGW